MQKMDKDKSRSLYLKEGLLLSVWEWKVWLTILTDQKLFIHWLYSESAILWDVSLTGYEMTSISAYEVLVISQPYHLFPQTHSETSILNMYTPICLMQPLAHHHWLCQTAAREEKLLSSLSSSTLLCKVHLYVVMSITLEKNLMRGWKDSVYKLNKIRKKNLIADSC